MGIIIDLLTGTTRLRDAWPKINTNFTRVKAEVDAIVLGSANAEVGQAHVSTAKSKTFTVIDDRFEEIETDAIAQLADNTSQLALKANQISLNTTNTNVTNNTNAIALKADQTSLVTTNANVSNNTSQIATNTTAIDNIGNATPKGCLLYTSPSPRDRS